MQEKPMTGYASIDKPWLKHYSQEQLSVEFTPMSMYQLMEKCNREHLSDIALSYFGTKITFSKLFSKIDETARSLCQLGVKPGDIVMMGMANTPEAVYIYYAVNKIGAVLNSFEPWTAVSELQKDIVLSGAKVAFIIDAIYPRIEEILPEVPLETLVVVSPYESISAPMKYILKVKNKIDIPKEGNISWSAFLKRGKDYNGEVPLIFLPNQPAVIVHTGGSTGKPKGVILSNESCNALIYQLIHSNFEFERQKVFLNFLPPCIALGLINATHLSMCLGMIAEMIPALMPEDFPNLVLKHKPNMIMAGPIHFHLMLKDEKMKNADLSFIEICVSGGDKMPLETQKQVQEFLKAHHSKANFCIGYGATETSAGTACMTNKDFRFESVGIPYLKNIMEVYDIDTGEKLKGYGKVGELRVNSPTLMLGYFGEFSNETDKVIWTDENGLKWYCTGDLAHFDSDGYLYIDGRIKRIITRSGFKIYPSYVEELILRHPAVKECAVVGVPDEEEIAVPVANIVLKDGFQSEEDKKEVIAYIIEEITKALPEYSYAQMAGYNFLQSLPTTAIGKLDFRALEKMGILEK